MVNSFSCQSEKYKTKYESSADEFFKLVVALEFLTKDVINQLNNSEKTSIHMVHANRNKVNEHARVF